MWGNIQLSHIWTGCNLYLIFIYSVSKSHHSGWTSDSWPYHTLPLVQLARCPPGGSLPRSICLVNLVQQLDVSSNRLTELPAALGKLPLRELCVANNQPLGLDIWRKSPVNLKAKFWCAGKISRKTMENPTLNWTLTWTFWLNKFSFWGTIWMKTPTLNGQLVGKVLWFPGRVSYGHTYFCTQKLDWSLSYGDCRHANSGSICSWKKGSSFFLQSGWFSHECLLTNFRWWNDVAILWRLKICSSPITGLFCRLTICHWLGLFFAGRTISNRNWPGEPAQAERVAKQLQWPNAAPTEAWLHRCCGCSIRDRSRQLIGLIPTPK